MSYFAYFSEIEERFQRRRGSILMLSTLDWSLIETWREAGIPLEAVLRGIDSAFDKHDAKLARAGARTRKVNGLAWCAQAVMQATEEMQEASVGIDKTELRPQQESGFETERVARFLDENARTITASLAANPGAPSSSTVSSSTRVGSTNASTPRLASETWTSTAANTAQRLTELANQMRTTAMPLDDLDRILTVLEERLVHALTHSVAEDQIVALRAQADRELAPYRAKMQPAQLKQVQQQFLLKRLLESHNLPRLSLFYMGHA